LLQPLAEIFIAFRHFRRHGVAAGIGYFLIGKNSAVLRRPVQSHSFGSDGVPPFVVP
jgi:hypothetical protein